MIHWCAQVAYDQQARARSEGRHADADWHQSWQEQIELDPNCAASYFYFSGDDIVYPARAKEAADATTHQRETAG